MKNFALIGAAGYIAPRHMRAIKDTGHHMAVHVNPAFVRANEVHRLCGSPSKLLACIGPLQQPNRHALAAQLHFIHMAATGRYLGALAMIRALQQNRRQTQPGGRPRPGRIVAPLARAVFIQQHRCQRPRCHRSRRCGRRAQNQGRPR